MKTIIATYSHILCNINKILHKTNKILPANVNELNYKNETCTCSRHHFYGRCTHLLSV